MSAGADDPARRTRERLAAFGRDITRARACGVEQDTVTEVDTVHRELGRRVAEDVGAVDTVLDAYDGALADLLVARGCP